MPHFGAVLTPDQIDAIMAYERACRSWSPTRASSPSRAQPRELWYPTILGDPRRRRRGRAVHAGRSTCCSAPTSAPASASSSRSPRSMGFMMMLTHALAHHRVAARIRSRAGSRRGRSVELVHATSTQVEDPRRSATSETKDKRRSRRPSVELKAAVDAALDHQGVDADDHRDAERQPVRQVRSDVTEYMDPRDLRRSAAATRSFWQGRVQPPDASTRSFEYCATRRSDQPFGLPPLPPECATAPTPRTARGRRVRLRHAAAPAVRRLRDRRHPVRARAPRLHWREKDEHAAEAAAKAEADRSGVADARRARTGEGRLMMRPSCRSSSLAAPLCASAALRRARRAPAGAQQLVDAGKEGDGSGGLAFVLMVVMVACIAASLFFMDRVRRNRLPQDDDEQPGFEPFVGAPPGVRTVLRKLRRRGAAAGATCRSRIGGCDVSSIVVVVGEARRTASRSRSAARNTPAVEQARGRSGRSASWSACCASS